MKNLISAKELISKLKNNEDMVIIDCRFDFDENYPETAYREGHIKGAYFLDLNKDLSSPIEKHGGINPLPDSEVLAAKLEKMGIDNDTYVVAYDEGDLNGAAKVLYQFSYMGINNVDVLDGGLPSFKNAGGVLETEIPRENHSDKKIELRIDNNQIADMEYIKERLYDPNTIIVDSRSGKKYKGISEQAPGKAGHIPGAKNFCFVKSLKRSYEDGSYRSIEEVGEFLKYLIDNKDKDIILYCGSGIAACVNGLSLRQFDVPHKLYIGSFFDWISYDGNELVTGEE